MKASYMAQVQLLTRILPLAMRNESFALHGGSAINLFYFSLPRLSVDIDLTLVECGQRDHDLILIKDFLDDLKKAIQSALPGTQVSASHSSGDEYKLFCRNKSVQVKLEVNTINRGIMAPVTLKALCNDAREAFRTDFNAGIVPESQLFGGKLVAALDRQHPRDLFDVQTLMEHQGITDEIMEGFLFCLLSSNRPFHEILKPALLDQRHTLEHQFSGMTDVEFTYEMFEDTRRQLIDTVNRKLSTHARDLIMSFASGAPVWDSSDYSMFPGIKWKLQNILALKELNPAKHQHQLDQLNVILYK